MFKLRYNEVGSKHTRIRLYVSPDETGTYAHAGTLTMHQDEWVMLKAILHLGAVWARNPGAALSYQKGAEPSLPMVEFVNDDGYVETP